MSIAAIKSRIQTVAPRGSLRARMAGGAFWSLSGSVLSQLVAATSAIIVARILGKLVFGEIGIVRSTIGMFGLLSGLGLDLTANRHVAQLKHEDPARAGRIVGLALLLVVAFGSVVSLAVAAFARPLAVHSLGAAHVAKYIRIASPILLLNAVVGVMSGALAGFEAFRRLNLVAAANATVLAVCTMVGAYFGGIEGALWGMLAAAAIGPVLYGATLADQCAESGVRVSFRGAWAERGVMGSFALPSLMAILLTGPVNWAAAALLVNAGGGFAELGVFNAAGQWRTLILFVPGAVGQVVLPLLSSLRVGSAGRQYLRVLRANMLVNLAIGLVLAAPVVLASPWIMALYGQSFRGHWLPLVLLAATAVVQAVVNVIGQAIASLGRMWWGFFLNLLWAVELLAGAKLMMRWGASGLAAAYLISYVLHGIQVAVYTAVVLRQEVGEAPAAPAVVNEVVVAPASPVAAVAEA